MRSTLSRHAPPGAADDAAARARIGAAVRHHIKSMIGVSCAVAVKEPGAVARSQGKAVRVRDLRRTARPSGSAAP